jgi:hypothetical protein
MLTNDEYHAKTDVVSNSMLNVLSGPKGPQLFDAYYISKTLKQPESDAMALGSLVHCLSLEPDAFESRFAEMPAGLDRVRKAGKIAWNCFESNSNIHTLHIVEPQDINRRTAAGKVEYAEFLSTVNGRQAISEDDWKQAQAYIDSLEATRGKTIIKRDEYETALACADALRGHNQIGPILEIENAMIEKPLSFEFEGVNCRCKPDWVSLDHALILDVKTTQDASPAGFARSAADYGYYRQAAFYRHAIELLTGIECRFLFACVETSAPYAVACYEPSAEMLRAGLSDIEALLAQYRYHFEANDWLQDWSKGIVPLNLPAWHKLRNK